MIKEHPIMFLALFIVLAIIGYIIDEIRWKLKSDDELYKMLQSTDPKRVMIGLKYLRKRKKDISEYIRSVVPFLIADSSMDRITAKMILKKHYPEDYLLIKEYSGSESLNACREKADPLLRKYRTST